MSKYSQQIRGKESYRWMEDLWDSLLAKIAASTSKAEIKKILENLVSNYEKNILLKRLGIIALMKRGKTYRETSEILWLSPNTISTIRKNLLSEKKHYKSYRDFYKGPKIYSSNTIRIPKSFWEESLEGLADFWEILNNPPRPKGLGILDSGRYPTKNVRHRKKNKRE